MRKVLRKMQVLGPKVSTPLGDEMAREAKELESLMRRKGIRAELPFRVEVE